MFRRPKKPIRPKVIMTEADGEEDEDMDYQEVRVTNNNPAPMRSKIPSGDPPKPPKKSTLLSFDEDVEEEEVFKVKKSSVSRRLMKERKKDTKSNKPEGSFVLSTSSAVPKSITGDEDVSILKVTNFVRILTGREAEAVDMESGSEDDETQMKFKPRPPADAVSEVLRRTLEQEQIPDANLIHEIRKKRQMARDGGTVPFIPVDDSVKYKPSKSRLIREDENDQSEDDDEKRIDFTIDSTQVDKERRREAFDAAQDQGKSLLQSISVW